MILFETIITEKTAGLLNCIFKIILASVLIVIVVYYMP